MKNNKIFIVVLKGLLSSDPPYKNGNARFTTISLRLWSDKKCGRYCRFSSQKKFLILIFFCVTFEINGNYQFSKSETFLCLIGQNLQMYRCESAIAVFAGWVTWDEKKIWTSCPIHIIFGKNLEDLPQDPNRLDLYLSQRIKYQRVKFFRI